MGIMNDEGLAPGAPAMTIQTRAPLENVLLSPRQPESINGISGKVPSMVHSDGCRPTIALRCRESSLEAPESDERSAAHLDDTGQFGPHSTRTSTNTTNDRAGRQTIDPSTAGTGLVALMDGFWWALMTDHRSFSRAHAIEACDIYLAAIYPSYRRRA